ncbi:hypothetical protein D9757_006436 [Collybiopsis confluens]|uniref:Uncharacterized protein n=1 Tax=Collybiopsis confluens TaxID=2823264 RepID=A0A8H5M8F8_9AGAR|nr:hypothetical protein D9757_006436 [Collybiopsis confluens]
MSQPHLAVASVTQSTSTLSSYNSSASVGSSLRTFMGLGSLSGKLLYNFGKLALKGYEFVIISRRLSFISSKFPHTRSERIPGLTNMYRDILELSRPGLYPDSYRLQALQILMAQIASRQTARLVEALETWPTIELCLLIGDIISRIDPTRSSGHAVYFTDPVLLGYQKHLSQYEAHSLTPFIDFLSEIVESNSDEVRSILDSGIHRLLLHFYVSDFRDPLVLDQNETLYAHKSSLAAACTTFLLRFEEKSGGLLTRGSDELDELYPFRGLCAEGCGHVESRDIQWRISSAFELLMDSELERSFDGAFLFDLFIDLVEFSGSATLEEDICFSALLGIRQLLTMGGGKDSTSKRVGGWGLSMYLDQTTPNHTKDILSGIIGRTLIVSESESTLSQSAADILQAYIPTPSLFKHRHLKTPFIDLLNSACRMVDGMPFVSPSGSVLEQDAAYRVQLLSFGWEVFLQSDPKLREEIMSPPLPHEDCVGVTRLSFVFDGPYPALKHPTVLSRSAQNLIHPILLFFRTSNSARSTPRYLNDPESKVFPSLLYPATVQTLIDLRNELSGSSKLDVVFADSEGDPFAVELAARMGAYVVANDSDYAILNTEGYKGWIPLDGIVWTASASPAEEETMESEEADGWQSTSKVSSSSRSRIAKSNSSSLGFGRGIIPPDSSNLSFSCVVHTPSSLASFLGIPATLLPLLGALLGNDYSNPNLSNLNQLPSYSGNSPKSKHRHHHLFFEHGLSLSARINRVASTLSSIITAAKSTTPHKKQKHQVDSVMDLISKSVKALSIRGADGMTGGELEAIIETVVDATLQYAIPQSDADGSASSLCPLHEPEYCQLLPIFSRNVETSIAEAEAELAGTEVEEEEGHAHRHTGDGPVPPIDSDLENRIAEKVRVRDTLIRAYRSGYLSPTLLNALTPSVAHHSSTPSNSVGTGTVWPKLFLENPDLETTPRSMRVIRMWMCSLLDDAVGLPEVEEELEGEEAVPCVDDDEDDGEEGEEGLDELVDVVESDSDMDDTPDVLAPLKGALHRLHHPDDEQNQSLDQHSQNAEEEKESSKRRVVVTEYIRHGTRVVGENVKVPEWGEVLKSFGIELPQHHHKVSSKLHLRRRRLENGSSPPIPFLLRPTSERLDVFLHLLTVPLPSTSPASQPPLKPDPHLLDLLRNLPPLQLCLALAFRWLMASLAGKVNEARNQTIDQQDDHSSWSIKDRQDVKDKIQARWTEREARCLLAAFDWEAHSGSDRSTRNGTKTGDTDAHRQNGQALGYPPIHSRSIQLTAQILLSLDSVHLLAEVMLLTGNGNLRADSGSNGVGDGDWDEGRSGVNVVTMPAHLFSGRKLHAYLSGTVPLGSSTGGVPEALWEVCSYGFSVGDGMNGEVFADEVTGKKGKKEKGGVAATLARGKMNKSNGRGGGGGGGKSGGAKGGLFELLGDVEA